MRPGQVSQKNQGDRQLSNGARYWPLVSIDNPKSLRQLLPHTHKRKEAGGRKESHSWRPELLGSLFFRSSLASQLPSCCCDKEAAQGRKCNGLPFPACQSLKRSQGARNHNQSHHIHSEGHRAVGSCPCILLLLRRLFPSFSSGPSPHQGEPSHLKSPNEENPPQVWPQSSLT